MPRSLKPQQVGEVKHRNLPIVIPIMLDRNSLEFFFEVAGEKTKCESADEAKIKAREKLESLATVEWESVIAIDHTESDGFYFPNGNADRHQPTRTGLKLSFERFERGRFEGRWRLKRRYIDDASEYELAQRKTDANAGCGYYQDHSDVIIPYSDSSWRALHAIVAGVHALNDKLAALLDEKADVVALLAKLGDGGAARLLSAASTAAQKAAKR
jgi:hypothetical protein